MNLLKIIAILAIIVAVAITIIYLMGQFEQTKPLADQATGLGTQAVDYVKGNIPMVTAYAGTATAAVGGVLAYKKQATDKVASVTTAANSQIKELKDSFSQEKEALNTQITDAQETAKQQITQATELQKQAETKATDFEQQTKTLAGQVQSAKDENAQFVKSLMQSANGALVTNPVDGKIYSVLKLPPEVQVK